jgi:integrase
VKDGGILKGSVRKKGATWSFRIDLGKIDGKRKQIERSGFKTEKEADFALSEVIHEYNRTGIFVENKKVTFQEVFNEFMENEAPNTRKFATIVRYKSLYNNHFQEFAPKYLFQISEKSIQEFINSKCKTHSDEYVRSIYNFCLVLFNYAVTKKYLKLSPMINVRPPQSYRAYGDIKTYSKDELLKMEERFKSTNLLTAFILGINLGIRVGECFALRFSDIDWNKETIKIDKQLQYQDKMWSLVYPKTVNGVRTIKLNKNLVEYLRNLNIQYENDKSEYGLAYKINTVMEKRGKNSKLIVVDDFINIKPNGAMLTTDSQKILSRICKNEFGIDFKFHNLRHTHATMLAEKGVNPKYVKDRLGHGKLEITLRYYTHVTDTMHNQVAEIVDTLF